MRPVTASAWNLGGSRGLALVASVSAAVLAPIEFVPGEELVRPEMLLLLGLSCAGLALGMWARNRSTT